MAGLSIGGTAPAAPAALSGHHLCASASPSWPVHCLTPPIPFQAAAAMSLAAAATAACRPAPAAQRRSARSVRCSAAATVGRQDRTQLGKSGQLGEPPPPPPLPPSLTRRQHPEPALPSWLLPWLLTHEQLIVTPSSLGLLCWPCPTCLAAARSLPLVRKSAPTCLPLCLITLATICTTLYRALMGAGVEVSSLGIGAWSWGDRSRYWQNELDKDSNLTVCTCMVKALLPAS